MQHAKNIWNVFNLLNVIRGSQDERTFSVHLSAHTLKGTFADVSFHTGEVRLSETTSLVHEHVGNRPGSSGTQPTCLRAGIVQLDYDRLREFEFWTVTEAASHRNQWRWSRLCRAVEGWKLELYSLFQVVYKCEFVLKRNVDILENTCWFFNTEN